MDSHDRAMMDYADAMIRASELVQEATALATKAVIKVMSADLDTTQVDRELRSRVSRALFCFDYQCERLHGMSTPFPATAVAQVS